MARMKLIFTLPFFFVLGHTIKAQEVKKAASGDEHAVDSLANFQYVPLIDSTKRDTISILPTTPTKSLDLIKVIAKKDSLAPLQSKPKPYEHPVPLYLEIGISANSYRGDLSGTYRSFSPSFHLGIQLNKKRFLNGYFGVSVGQVSGETTAPAYFSAIDQNLQANTYFNTIFFTARYELHINIIKKEWITAYIGAGIGFLNFTPYDKDGNSLIPQGNTRAKGESYTNNSAIFPVSIGVLFSLKNYWGIHVQAGFLNPTTAYLDNISQLSTNQRGDNVLSLKFSVMAPLKVNK